jgi:hypothetical protein
MDIAPIIWLIVLMWVHQLSTKFVEIIFDVFTKRNKLFKNPTRNQLRLMIQELKKLTSLLNICGLIDGIHIPLIDLQNKKVTLAQSDFFNRIKNSQYCVLQGVCDVDKRFWNVCVGQPRGIHDDGQFKVFSLYRQIRDRGILQKLVILVRSVRCTPYIIGDSFYPI